MTDWHPDPPVYAACKKKEGDRLACLRALLEEGADPNARDYRGYPPLSCWEVRRDPALMDILLAGGADPNGMSRGNRILGGVIRDYPFQDTPQEKAALLVCVKKLLCAGADPNLYPYNVEHSPLWIAIKWKWLEVIPVLIEAGAAPELTNESGQDALAWAVQCEDLAVVEVLAGPEAAAAAADGSQDAACDEVFGAIVQQLRTHGRKLHFTGPGFKYEYEVFHEYYWEAGVWVEVRYDDYIHKRPADAVMTTLGPDDSALRARIVHVEQLHLTIRKPRARAWRHILLHHVQDRDHRDFIAQLVVG